MKRILHRMTAIAVLLILLLLCACGTRQEPVESTQGPVGDSVITVNAVGDIYLTDEMLSDAIKPDGTYDFMSQFSDVYACLSKADLTIGNFEGTFAGEPYGPAGGSYPDELAAALNDAGFDLLQTAVLRNHRIHDLRFFQRRYVFQPSRLRQILQCHHTE